MENGTVDEVNTQEVEEYNEEIDDFESHVGLNSMTHEHEASTNMETGNSDRFGAVRTINKTIDGMQRSDFEETSRQRGKTRISTSTKLPGTNSVTPPVLTPLVDTGIDGRGLGQDSGLDEYLASNLSRMTREAEEREKRLRGDLEQLQSQQEQALGTLDT